MSAAERSGNGDRVFLSLYTCVKDALYWDLHAESMLRHHLPLADEIVVNEGFSSDGTFERIKDLDPKIRVVRTRWPRPRGLGWYASFKDTARRLCRGDWCLHLDCDEFVPEWEFEPLRRTLRQTSEDLLFARFVNFYGNYKVVHSSPATSHWPDRKMVLHRNRPDIEFWGDGSNVRVAGTELQWPAEPALTVHHFGFVRDPTRLRQKWRNQQGRVYGTGRFSLPPVLFRWFPHRWEDAEFLPYLRLHGGPDIAAVRDHPDEFVRDGFQMYDLLKRTDLAGVSGSLVARP